MTEKCQGWPFMALGVLIPAIRIVSISSLLTLSSVKYWVVAISLTNSTAFVFSVCSVPGDFWLTSWPAWELDWEHPHIRHNADMAATRGMHFVFIIYSPSFLIKIIQWLSKLTEISVYISSPRPDQWQARPPKLQSRSSRSDWMQGFRFHPCEI